MLLLCRVADQYPVALSAGYQGVAVSAVESDVPFNVWFVTLSLLIVVFEIVELSIFEFEIVLSVIVELSMIEFEIVELSMVEELSIVDETILEHCFTVELSTDELSVIDELSDIVEFSAVELLSV